MLPLADDCFPPLPRHQLRQTEPAQLASILNTVWTQLPTSEKAVLEWLQQIGKESSSSAAHKVQCLLSR